MTVIQSDLFKLKLELRDKFVSQIQNELNGYGVDGDIHITHVEDTEFNSFWIVVCRFQALDLGTLSELIEYFKKYWTMEPPDGAAMLNDGRLATLGDGDDSQAAYFAEGSFRIWLRIWPLGDEYMNASLLTRKAA